MKNKVKSITKKVPQTATLPNGLYKGTWGGYVIELDYNGETYVLTTQTGVKGINIPVAVEVKNGEITFAEIKN